jgi:large subunit ribosomal protein L30
MLKITLIRSHIGIPDKQKQVLHSLGLRRIGTSTTKPDDPVFRGMIHKVSHLVKVTEE